MPESILDFARPAVRALTPYKGGKSKAEAGREQGLADYIKLASNECPYPTSLAVRRAIAVHALEINLYPDGNCRDLKQLLADRHRVSVEQITLGNGSSELLEMLVLAFADSARGDELLTTRHAFLVYKLLAMTHGLGYREAPLDGWAADLAQLAQMVGSSTRLVCLANPANPTGAVVDNSALHAFIRDLPAHTLMLLDQAYADFYPHSDEALDWLHEHPNLVLTRTFSKAIGLAGLRIGYSISSPEIANLLNRVRQPFNVNSLAQAAAIAALQDQQTLARTIENNTRYRERLRSLCEELDIACLPSEANFLTLDLGGAERADALESALMRKGVIVRGLANYAMPAMLRVSIGTPEQMERLFAALSACA